MLNRLKNMAESAFSKGEKLISRAIDQSTFKRVIAAGYLIANADGDFDSNEKSALAKIIKKEMSQYDISDILKEIEECDNKVSFDKKLGTMEILDFIGGASEDDGKLIMRVACYIGESDGKFDQDEKLVARDICIRLKLKMSDYGL